MLDFATVFITDGDLLIYGGLGTLLLLTGLGYWYGPRREPATDRR